MICIYVSVYLCISYSVLIFDHSNPEDAKRITCSIDSFEPTDSEASSGEAVPRVFECYRWMEVDEMRWIDRLGSLLDIAMLVCYA